VVVVSLLLAVIFFGLFFINIAASDQTTALQATNRALAVANTAQSQSLQQVARQATDQALAQQAATVNAGVVAGVAGTTQAEAAQRTAAASVTAAALDNEAQAQSVQATTPATLSLGALQGLLSVALASDPTRVQSLERSNILRSTPMLLQLDLVYIGGAGAPTLSVDVIRLTISRDGEKATPVELRGRTLQSNQSEQLSLEPIAFPVSGSYLISVDLLVDGIESPIPVPLRSSASQNGFVREILFTVR